METVQNGPQLLPVSAKDLLAKDLDRYREDPDSEVNFDVGVRNKDLRKNRIFSENPTNKKVLAKSPVVVRKHPTTEEKVRKWSLANMYRTLRLRLSKQLKKKDQVEGFEQLFYTGEQR